MLNINNYYLSIKDLPSIFKIIKNITTFDFSEQLLDIDLYCIIESIDINLFPLKYNVTLKIISKKDNISDCLYDSEKIYLALLKSPHIERIERNTKLEYVEQIDGKKSEYLDMNIFLTLK